MDYSRREAVKLNMMIGAGWMLSATAAVAQAGNTAPKEHWLWWDSALSFKLVGSDTGGSTTFILLEAKPKEGSPLHKHAHEDEVFYVLSGTFEFVVNENTFSAGQGSCIFGPKAIPHRWTNVGSEPGRMLTAFTPSGIEEFFGTLAVPLSSPEDRPHLDMAQIGPRIPVAAAKAGLVLVGPKKYPQG